MSISWSEGSDAAPQPCWLDRMNWLAEVLTPREAARLLLQLDTLLNEGERRMGRRFSDAERDQVVKTLRLSARRNS